MIDTLSMHAEHRETLQRKIDVMLDHVTAVARRYKHGFFLYGAGGIGKSYSVLNHLEKLEASVILYNSRMTAKGLLISLKDAPDAIHVLEDVERLTTDRDAQGVLRSALWAQPGKDRIVTWTTATDPPVRFPFRGGIILISNRPLANLPELRALATRIEVHQLDVSDPELIALMRELAEQGYIHDNGDIEPEECLMVTEHVLKECQEAGCKLDLRLQQKGFQTYLQWKAGDSVTPWYDLIAASVREATHQREADDDDKMTQKRNVLREIMAKTDDPKERLKEYMKRTKASRADFFRRKSEIDQGEFDEQDAA